MGFQGFTTEGIDLLQLNRLHNDKTFYDAHKDEIRRVSVEPFHQLIADMTSTMLEIDPSFLVVPSRMISRIRRDTRYTHDKTLYRANIWMYFRRPRAPFEDVPFFYFEVQPECWSYGCWGAFGRGEMAEVRNMILKEDRLFLEAHHAVSACEDFVIAGEQFKRPKHPDAKPEYQDWLNRKHIGVDHRETENFAPLLDGSFVQPMLQSFQKLAPFYRMLLAAKERAGAGGTR